MNVTEIHIYAESDDLYRDAAEWVVQTAGEAIERDGRFAWLLSGGDTPRRLYALLGSSEYGDRIDWTLTHLFWGDERAVPISDPRSNYRMVAETLLSRVEVPGQNLHRIRITASPEESATEYENELHHFFGARPAFHLALLGMGADGHTASLFPGSPALGQGERLVVAAAPPPPDAAGPRRITLTLPALNASESVLFLVTGAAKAPALAAALEGPPDPDLPAQLVQPASGSVVWLVDRAAAQFLKRKTLSTA